MKKLLLIVLTFMVATVSSFAQNYKPEIGDKITTEDGIFIVKGTNLIQNPDFDDGFDNWLNGSNAALTDDCFQIVSSGGPDGSQYLNAISNGGSSSTAALKTGWAIETGKIYLFSCWSKRTSSAMSSNTEYSRIFLGSSATSTSTEIAKITYVADTWTQTEIVFEATNSYCIANFGWLNNGSSFDCFFLGEVEASDELATAILEGNIAEAEELLSSTTEGNETGQYTSEVRGTLQSAIDTAKNILASATTQQQINDANTDLVAAMSTYEQSANPPFTIGEQYSFTNVASGDLVLSSGSGGTVKIIEEDNSNSMVFTFEKAPDGSDAIGYNIKDADGYYIYRSGSWDTYSSTTADLTVANSIFQIIEYSDHIQIKNMGSGSVLGVDNTTNGSTVYSNKNGSDNKYNWVMTKYVPVSERDDKYYFELSLEEAQKTYNAVDTKLIGSDAFWYSEDAYNALGNAIATSQTMSDYSAAKTYIENAVAEFEANKVVAPGDGVPYEITHYGGATLFYEEGNTHPIITVTDESTVQSYEFVATDVAGAYAIMNSESGYFLAKDTSGANNWDTMWGTDMSIDEAKWYVSIYSVDVFTMQCVANSGYLGSDSEGKNASDDKWLYCDKSASANYSHWNIELAIVLDFTAFDAALEQANAFLGSMVEGYEVGEYFASDIAAFTELISADQASAKKMREQEDLDALAVQLLADIETYKAKAHTKNVADEYLKELVATCQEECDAAVAGVDKGQYPQDVIDAFQAAIDTANSATSGYEAAVDALRVARETFQNSVMTVDRSTLKTRISSAETALGSAVAGDCDGQYPADAISAYQVALTSAQTVYNNVSATQEEVDAAATDIQSAANDFAAAKVVINFSDLRSSISTANSTISAAESDKGDGPGKYPESAFTALQEKIDEAQAIVGSGEVNQAAVDAMTQELDEAIETFIDSRHPLDFSELEAYLAKAEEIYDAMMATGAFSSADMNVLAEDIEKGKTALTTTSQDEIDKVVKILARDVELFSDIATGISSLMSGMAHGVSGGVLNLRDIPAGTVIVVYDANGRSLANSNGGSSLSIALTRGIYIITASREDAKVSAKVMVN